jgi:alpha-beta hydrolase superfamily lysophospholipase
LLLHGGKEHSVRPAQRTDLSAVRMRPFARAIHAQGAPLGVAVWELRYRVRGWNGEQRSPVPDARWALEEVRRRHGAVPVVLVGHSMGGRTAVHVLDDPSVTALVALAPWLPDEPVAGATGKRVLVVHGTADSVTSPRETWEWAEQARPLAGRLLYVRVGGSGHALLRRARLWTDLAVGWTLTSLGLDPSVGRAASQVLGAAAGGAPSLEV